MIIKTIVILFLIMILISLFTALFKMMKVSSIEKTEADESKTVRALTVRISLSVVLFLLLMAGFYFGIIPSQGLR